MAKREQYFISPISCHKFWAYVGIWKFKQAKLFYSCYKLGVVIKLFRKQKESKSLIVTLETLQKLSLTDLEVFFFFSQNLCCLLCPLYDFLVNLEYILLKLGKYFLLLFLAWGAHKHTHSHSYNTQGIMSQKKTYLNFFPLSINTHWTPGNRLIWRVELQTLESLVTLKNSNESWLWQPHSLVHTHGLKYLINISLLACHDQFPHGNIIKFKFSRLAFKALTSKSLFNNNSLYQTSWIDLQWNRDN